MEGYCKKLWQIGGEHSTYCGKNLGCDHPVSQYSISLRTCAIDVEWPSHGHVGVFQESVTFRPRYSSLNQYSLSIIKER